MIAGLALIAAGCASGHAKTAPRVSWSVSVSVLPAGSPTPLTPIVAVGPVDQAVCKRLEAFPPFTTIRAAWRYASPAGERFVEGVPLARRALAAWLFRMSATPGLAPWLSGHMTRAATDLRAVSSGRSTERQVRRDAAELQAVCTSYGIRG